MYDDTDPTKFLKPHEENNGNSVLDFGQQIEQITKHLSELQTVFDQEKESLRHLYSGVFGSIAVLLMGIAPELWPVYLFIYFMWTIKGIALLYTIPSKNEEN